MAVFGPINKRYRAVSVVKLFSTDSNQFSKRLVLHLICRMDYIQNADAFNGVRTYDTLHPFISINRYYKFPLICPVSSVSFLRFSIFNGASDFRRRQTTGLEKYRHIGKRETERVDKKDGQASGRLDGWIKSAGGLESGRPDRWRERTAILDQHSASRSVLLTDGQVNGRVGERAGWRIDGSRLRIKQ